MKPLTLNEYNLLVAKSSILEQDRRGIKVLKAPDGLIVKLFRRKRLISSAMIKPYASRFIENARSLEKRGIKTVCVEDVFYCKEIKRTLVFYQPVPGETLRDRLQDQTHSDDIMEKFSAFLAELHDKGVLFRSIHLNNVVLSDDMQTLGLIDIADMKVYSKGLSRTMRLRNFRHLTRYTVDQLSIKSFGIDRFMNSYFQVSQLSGSYKEEFQDEMQQLMSEEGRG